MSHKERLFTLHGLGKLPEGVKKCFPHILNCFAPLLTGLELEQSMKGQNISCRNEIDPYPHSCFRVRVRRQDFDAVIRIRILEELTNDRRFVQRFIIVLKRWNKPTGVEG